LREEDFIGLENFQDATGRISQGAKVILRTVKVGDNLLENVEATVIDNENAPLLLGQSALERFGIIQIDNDNNRIIFK
jgi:aspartyl protease family protein